jgi:serine/threonine protein kinase
MVDDQWLGAELAGYRIEGLIGRGGVGVVHRATQLRLQRPAAVKLLAAGFATVAEYRRTFEREARWRQASSIRTSCRSTTSTCGLGVGGRFRIVVQDHIGCGGSD